MSRFPPVDGTDDFEVIVEGGSDTDEADANTQPENLVGGSGADRQLKSEEFPNEARSEGKACES